jgi:hypothetical protein
MTDMPRHRKVLAALTAITVLATAGAAAQQKSDDSFHWTGTIAAGRTLRIQDVNGSIRATGTSSKEASVSALRRSKKSDPRSVEIRVQQDGDLTIICAVWPNQQDADGCDERSHNDNDHGSRNDVDVEFTVSVPAGVKFEGRTVNGSVAAGGLVADAEVASVNGDVSLATRGTGSAETVNGNVRLTMGTSSWTGDLEVKTVNGSVTVEMPTPANLDVRANTLNGDISSDFPMTIQGKMSPRSMRGTIGNGGPRLELSTVNGPIELKKAN